MCGIVGYVGTRPAVEVVMGGLRRLEYRGYDSGGIALVTPYGIASAKRAGKLANLDAALTERPLPQATTGIGHTRWATHGAPNDVNAHPHLDATGRIAVVHNGIIENFALLREELESEGYEFLSETDTETVAHLVHRSLQGTSDLGDAVREVCRRLEGAFTLVIADADTPDMIVGARRNSPLVVGRGDGENFLGSDVAAFIDYTASAIELGQDQVVEITADEVRVTDFHGAPVATKEYTVDWDVSAAEKGGYDWFMVKEIHEQPQAIADTLLGRIGADGRLQLDEMRLSDGELREVDKIIVIACGTSYYAGMVAKYAIEHWTRIPCEVELASEFRYRDPILDHTTLVVTISQSGETMDTLMAIRYAREQRARVLSICNTNGSTIPRESDAVIYTHAGPEIAVASTKGFLAQVVACYLLALYFAQAKGVKYGDEIRAILDELEKIPAAVQTVLDRGEQVRKLAGDLSGSRSIMFLGRHVGYPVALEGALKLKELAYLHAEGFAAGELKHGPIAVIEEGVPVFVVVPPKARDQLQEKILSNIQEVRARGARTIVLVEEGDDSVVALADEVIRLPRVPTLLQPLVATVPLQIFACEIATRLGHDVDQPRNLAKSVTVE
ncbi:glutamine--fructose-6-phosphate transaminase (isomerizing) [uncultured Aeromicrobium sp.]|uniref:glutamine--fructose-6-phosphate transaminase (isomerizing) n=1 Tax=uncultured Aeromicrobium sp. TaxID=337820 RepID=UPI0025EE44BB|nr:glutamine--fructose-6-phosphate transaminase (isomerizing) [uncultured Aeromicrobium sp.]